jgi:hypothetical protein
LKTKGEYWNEEFQEENELKFYLKTVVGLPIYQYPDIKDIVTNLSRMIQERQETIRVKKVRKGLSRNLTPTSASS